MKLSSSLLSFAPLAFSFITIEPHFGRLSHRKVGSLHPRLDGSLESASTSSSGEPTTTHRRCNLGWGMHRHHPPSRSASRLTFLHFLWTNLSKIQSTHRADAVVNVFRVEAFGGGLPRARVLSLLPCLLWTTHEDDDFMLDFGCIDIK
ncbi:hypothetical protein XPA_010746 [Xanthoria parietina]